VVTKRDLKAFIAIPFDIYKGNPYWVPPLISEELKNFDKKHNPAFKNADSRLFIAYKNGKPIGRIAAIISFAANKKYNTKNLRFGWFDTIDDYETAAALFDEVEKWGKELGMDTLTGPHGFSDLDPEGMLVEGFDHLPTIAVVYNNPYYPTFAEKYGFKKDVDYLEFLCEIPGPELLKKLLRIADKIKERSSFKILEFKKKKELLARGSAVFHLLNDAFENIYGSVPLTEEQINYYIKKYFSFVDKDLVKVAVNKDDEAIGFVITITNLSRPFQKAKGKLLPWGWYHILKGLMSREILDLYLVGVDEKYRGLGVDLLMVTELARAAVNKGFKLTQSNVILEKNLKAQAQLKFFNPVVYRRARIFKKKIGR
jgi:ribosomal protein S18 acetylase RimI-like enzyme